MISQVACITVKNSGVLLQWTSTRSGSRSRWVAGLLLHQAYTRRLDFDVVLWLHQFSYMYTKLVRHNTSILQSSYRVRNVDITEGV